MSNADDLNTVFGRQFHEVEEGVKASGIAYTLFRLPLFTDNNWCVMDCSLHDTPWCLGCVTCGKR